MLKPTDLTVVDGDEVTPVTVCKSNAGYYIGRLYWDDMFNCLLPYDRLSVSYYRTAEEANEALATGAYEVRNHP